MMLHVTDDPYAVAAASAARLTSLAGRPDVAVVLGSGLPIREVSRAALAAATAYGSSVTSSIMAHVGPARDLGRHFRRAGNQGPFAGLEPGPLGQRWNYPRFGIP